MTPLQITGYALLTYFLIGLFLGILMDIKAVHSKVDRNPEFAQKMEAIEFNFTQTRIAMVFISVFVWPMSLFWDLERLFKKK